MYLDPSSSRRHLISTNQVHSKPNLIEGTCPIQDPDYGVFASHSSARTDSYGNKYRAGVCRPRPQGCTRVAGVAPPCFHTGIWVDSLGRVIYHIGLFFESIVLDFCQGRAFSCSKVICNGQKNILSICFIVYLARLYKASCYRVSDWHKVITKRCTQDLASSHACRGVRNKK